MKNILSFLILLMPFFGLSQRYVIALHGGAGNGIRAKHMPDSVTQLYEIKMLEALEAGQAILDTGGKAVNAVVAVISVLEDSPLFNAGKGAVFTYDERNELDASIMTGDNLNAGAVAGITRVKNPITAALAVLNHSPHVLLSREGADDFAEQQGLLMVQPEYFQTDKRRKSLERFKEKYGAIDDSHWEDTKMGTVGCVVLDKHGNLAAGTSTGGMTGKRNGRIGDSPIIGAGTYANNRSCAISCTGHGEYFIRYAVAHDVSARMLYQGATIKDAAQTVIHKVLKDAGGDGGLIGVDYNGNIVMEFNTLGMFRASIKEGEKPTILMFK